VPLSAPGLRLGRNTLIGIAIATLSAAVLTWSLLGKPDPFAGQHVVWAQFRDVSTLVHFDRNVRVGGADVGTVGEVKRRGDIALVELDLDGSVISAIRSDATAELRPHTLFDGNSYVELDPGSPSAPPLGHHIIPLSRTRNYVSLEQALRVFDEPTRLALQRTVANLRSALGSPQVDAVRHTLSNLPQLVRNTAVWARAALGPSGTELAASIRGLSKTVAAVASASNDIGPTLTSTLTTANAVNAADPALDNALAHLPQALTASQSGSEALRQALIALQPLAVDLQPAMRQLAPTLVELRPVLRQLDPVLRRSPQFFATLRQTLAAGVTASAPTSALLRRLQPTIITIQRRLIPFLLSKTPAGSTVIDSLAALSAGAAGTLSPVKTLQQGSTGNEGPGHMFYLSPLAGFQASCASIPVSVLVQLLQRLQLCTP
jgi:ABC-type transporter Mla subunit MlaD